MWAKYGRKGIRSKKILKLLGKVYGSAWIRAVDAIESMALKWPSVRLIKCQINSLCITQCVYVCF